MSKIEKIIFALIGLVFILGAVWVFQSWQQMESSNRLGGQAVTGSVSQPLDYNQAKQAEDPANPCVPPAGYTEETWREHMGHHPDQYKQCLGG